MLSLKLVASKVNPWIYSCNMHDWGTLNYIILTDRLCLLPILCKNRYLVLHYVSRNYKNGAANQKRIRASVSHSASWSHRVLPLEEDSKIVKCNFHLSDPWEASQAQERWNDLLRVTRLEVGLELEPGPLLLQLLRSTFITGVTWGALCNSSWR